jgi:hypothetical protein
MLWSGAAKGVDGRHHFFQHFGRRVVAAVRETAQDPGFAKVFAVIVLGFDQAVGEDQQRVPGPEDRTAFLIDGVGFEAERKASGFQALHGTGGPVQDGPVVPRVYVGKHSGFVLPFGDECGSKPVELSQAFMRLESG